MRIKSIRLVNVQAFNDVTFDFPKNGIVGIVGENSNGKSILGKALYHILTGQYNDPNERRDIIKNNCDSCDIIVTLYEGDVLHAHIGAEAKDTWFSLNGTKRYHRDKNLGEFITSFGFHSNTELEYSLHLHRDLDQSFLVDTDPRFNYEAVTEAAIDKRANLALERLDQNIQEFKTFQAYYDTEIKKCDAGLETITIFDITGYEEDIFKVEEMIKVIDLLDFEIDVPENVVSPITISGMDVNSALAVVQTKYFYLPESTINPIDISIYEALDLTLLREAVKRKRPIYPKVSLDLLDKINVEINFEKEIKEIQKNYLELKDISESRCPTCKRGFEW